MQTEHRKREKQRETREIREVEGGKSSKIREGENVERENQKSQFDTFHNDAFFTAPFLGKYLCYTSKEKYNN